VSQLVIERWRERRYCRCKTYF